MGQSWYDRNIQFCTISLVQFRAMRMPARRRGRDLYEEIKARIVDGTYAAGSALASTRACADERALSRTTVSAVYEQLAAEGFIHSRPGASSRVAAGIARTRATATDSRRVGRGHKVNSVTVRLSAVGERLSKLDLPSVAAPRSALVDFAYGPLAGGDFPTLTWLKAMRRIERLRSARLAYDDPRGDAGLRRAIQSYLSRARGLSCDVDQIIIVNGSQQALDLCGRVLLDSGDIAVVENPGYRMAHRVFESIGAGLHGIDVDDQGLKTDLLAGVPHAQLAYVTPTHQFPTGAFLSAGRRRALLDWSARTGAVIVEDDYDSEYRYSIRPEPTLLSLDELGTVIYVGTFSKTLSPQLRLGYMVLPHHLVKTFETAKRMTDRHTPTGLQRTLAMLLDDGSYDRHVRRMRRLQQARRVALLQALEKWLHGYVTVQGEVSGLHLVATVPRVSSTREARLIQLAEQEGVCVYPLSSFYLPGAGSHDRAGRAAGLVMGYAMLEQKQIAVGVQRLAAAIRKMASSRKEGPSWRRG
jgi:GntR family transcriptional regulator/MocR family aminotransferase